MIFSPLVGYGFFLCSASQALRVEVVSLYKSKIISIIFELN